MLNINSMLIQIGYDNMTEYYFGNKKKAHKFCKTCGTSILIHFKRNEYAVTGPEEDQLAVNVASIPSSISILSYFSFCIRPLHQFCWSIHVSAFESFHRF
jgi:hypothetical protein